MSSYGAASLSPWQLAVAARQVGNLSLTYLCLSKANDICQQPQQMERYVRETKSITNASSASRVQRILQLE